MGKPTRGVSIKSQQGTWARKDHHSENRTKDKWERTDFNWQNQTRQEGKPKDYGQGGGRKALRGEEAMKRMGTSGEGLVAVIKMARHVKSSKGKRPQ